MGLGVITVIAFLYAVNILCGVVQRTRIEASALIFV